ncbi:hypothetical protein HYPSUDRAFT_409128 [Hypholoma sublateritium FD-334 SS-4]|uniref:Uncharacterized protein n=1 Tax=Hypholoma sublateritium (strain FD-334 SS-4) TaxID=945553 RepID=A0A0D2P404_HYPSF|nr:hypothetical protein HYPSUDRAFT_409128 [Hypholoma sublateritium FD-334 SS-4]
MKDVEISGRAPSPHPIITTESGYNNGASPVILIDLTKSPRHQCESPRPEDLQRHDGSPVVHAHAEVTLPAATRVDLTGQSAREIRNSPPAKRLKISTTAPPLDLVDTGKNRDTAPAGSLVVSFSSVPQVIPTTSTHRPVSTAWDMQHSHSEARRVTNDVAANRSGKRKRVEEAVNNEERPSSQPSWSWWRQGDVRWPSPTETRPWRREATKAELQDIDIRRCWEEDWARARQRRSSSLWNSPGAIQKWIEKCDVGLPTAGK